jgi:hypothetical protein
VPFVEKAQFFGNSRSRLFTIHTCEAGADLVPDAIMRTSVDGVGNAQTFSDGDNVQRNPPDSRHAGHTTGN